LLLEGVMLGLRSYHDTDLRTREGGPSSEGPKKIDLIPWEDH